MKRVQPLLYILVLSQSYLFSQHDDFNNLTGPYLGQKSPGIIPEIFAEDLASTKHNI